MMDLNNIATEAIMDRLTCHNPLDLRLSKLRLGIGILPTINGSSCIF